MYPGIYKTAITVTLLSLFAWFWQNIRGGILILLPHPSKLLPPSLLKTFPLRVFIFL